MVPRARIHLTPAVPRGGGAPGAAGIAVVAATRLEAAAVRRAAPGARVIGAGIGLRRIPASQLGDAVVTCGLAGGVRTGLPSGAVVIPARVLRPGGEWRTCDPGLVELFSAAARGLGYEVEQGPLGTPDTMVYGAERRRWAAQGCVAVDMETGLLDASTVAAVRVVLDTPERDLSPVWMHPLAALARPHLWPEGLWLWRTAPRYAARAAAILACGLRSRSGGWAPATDG